MMDGDEAPSFATIQEEIQYWKNQALQYRKGMLDAREELDEFQEQSRELEQELEVQLEQADKRTTELRSINSRILSENEALKDRVDQMQQEYNAQLNSLETDLGTQRSQLEDWQKYIRELEQSNDDLERSQRVMVASIEDFESKLNQVIERNAFLESELDEKETMRTMVQRLKDEARDLKQELKVRERRSDTPDAENKKNLELSRVTPIDCSKLIKFDTQNNLTSQTSTPLKLSQHNGGSASPALTPSARISALNIVGDLLRGVGALEARVAHARTTPINGTDASPRYSRRTSSRATPATTAPSTPSNGPTQNGTSSPNLIRA